VRKNMQKRLMLLGILITVLVIGLSTTDSSYATDMTGTWTNMGGGVYNSTAGTVDVSASATGAWSGISTGTTNTDGTFFSNGSAANHNSLQSTFGSRGGTITFNFSANVTNPVLHIDRIGGASGGQSTSARFTVTSGQTIQRLTGPNHFVVSGNTFYRTSGQTTSGTEASWYSRNGTAAGSIRFIGTFDTVTLSWNCIGTSNDDQLELVWELEGPRADLTVDKYPNRNPSYYNVGDEVVFAVTARNSGPGAATGVVVTDTLPAGLTFVSATDGGVWDPVTRTVTWTVGNLAVDGEFSALLTALINAGTQGQTLVNAVSAVNDQNPDAVTDTCDVTVNNAVLTVDKQSDRDPANYNAGEVVVFAVTARNSGPSAATGVVVTDTLPAGLTFVSASNGGVWDPVTRTVTWTVGNLAVDGEFSAFLTALINAGTQGQTLVNAVSAVNDQNPDAVTDTCDVTVNDAPLTITKTVGKAQYDVGETVTYTVNVVNGAGAATGVVVTDTLPVGLTFVSASDGGVWDANTRTVTWTVGNLAVGASFTPTVTATVTGDAAAKTLVNTATADNDQMDNPVSAVASFYVPSADLVLTKTVDKSAPMVKDTVVFTLIVNNNGPDTAVDVTVDDKLPAGLTYVSHVANFGTYDPVTGLWSISSLPNGASAVLTITAVVEESGRIVNQANVTALTWDPNLEGNTASAAMDVREQPKPEPKPVHGKTVKMEKTGAPIGALLVAFFMLLAGMVLPRRK